MHGSQAIHGWPGSTVGPEQDVFPDPLGGGLRSALGGPPSQVREACLPPYLVWNLVGRVSGCRFCHAVDDLIAWDPSMGGDPNDADLVSPGHHPVCDLYDCPGPLLSRSQ